MNERRNTKLVQSALVARAAASGAGASDPTVNKLARDIAEEGELRSAMALYEGEARAGGLRGAASLSRFRGGQALKAGKTKRRAYTGSAAATLLGGAATMFSKYGEAFKSQAAFSGREVEGLPWLLDQTLRERDREEGF